MQTINHVRAKQPINHVRTMHLVNQVYNLGQRFNHAVAIISTVNCKWSNIWVAIPMIFSFYSCNHSNMWLQWFNRLQLNISITEIELSLQLVGTSIQNINTLYNCNQGGVGVLRRLAGEWSLNASFTEAEGSQEEGKRRGRPLRKRRRQTWWRGNEMEVTHGAAARVRSWVAAVLGWRWK
jgi:hypothetical protein